MVGRKTKLKITEDKFQKYLLENYIDNDGDKVSDRELWSSDKFMNITGIYRKDKYSDKKIMVSLGTVSYWKKKLNINEKSIFHYHRTITKRIKNTVMYDEWSRMNNTGHQKKKVITDLSRRTDLIKILNLGAEFKSYSVDIIMEYMRDIWRVANKDIEKETENVMKQLDMMKMGDTDV
ncbi:MAG: hypothetical protein ACRCRT_00170 [Cetobacterium somerae]